MKNLLNVVALLLSCVMCAICASVLIIWFANSNLNQIPNNEIWRITSLDNTGYLIIANDKVLLHSKNSLGDVECACVYAADKKTGEILWSTEELAKPHIAEYKKLYPDSIWMPGRVEVIGTDNEKNIVYITINNSSLYALAENDGNVIWGPINVLDYAFPNAKSSNLIFVLDENGYLSAFDKSNGQELWKTANLSIIPDSRARVLTHENIVYVSFADDDKNRMIAFDARNSKELWSTDIKSFSYFYNFSANYLYLIWQGYYPDKMGQILVIDLKDGQKLWNSSFPDYALDPSPPQVVGNEVYVVENKDQTLSKLVARDATSGEILWEFNKDYSEGGLRYTPYDNVVYVGGETGNLYALDPQTGKEIWKSATNAFPTCMTVINDSLIIESRHNYVASFSALTGAQKWLQSFPVGAHTSGCFEDGSPVRIHNNRLFVVDWDRKVHSLDLETGKELWSWHDFRYPAWRLIPISKPIPEIAVIEEDVIYVFNSWTLADGVFAFKIR